MPRYQSTQQHRQQSKSASCAKHHRPVKEKPIPKKDLVPLFVPRTAQTKSRSVEERTKDSRVRGADLYVARLSWKTQYPEPPRPQNSSTDSSTSTSDRAIGTDAIERILTGSLHDEILQPSNPQLPAQKPQVLAEQMLASLSRPCYRCVSYMDVVGIKRVFWTNGEGGWDGGKVRDLVDGLESSGSLGNCGAHGVDAGKSGGAAGNGVFVTKHEVLMLRRLMGA